MVSATVFASDFPAVVGFIVGLSVDLLVVVFAGFRSTFSSFVPIVEFDVGDVPFLVDSDFSLDTSAESRFLSVLDVFVDGSSVVISFAIMLGAPGVTFVAFGLNDVAFSIIATVVTSNGESVGTTGITVFAGCMASK